MLEKKRAVHAIRTGQAADVGERCVLRSRSGSRLALALAGVAQGHVGSVHSMQPAIVRANEQRAQFIHTFG